MSYTKGEWFAHREGFSTVYVEARIGGGMLQEVAACGPTEGGPDEQEDNALLIAAAPDLLEALQERIDNDEQAAFEDWLRITCPSGDVDSVQRQWEESSLYSDFLDDTEKARAAIAKALGEQS